MPTAGLITRGLKRDGSEQRNTFPDRMLTAHIHIRVDHGDIVQNVFHRCQFIIEMQGDLFVASGNDVRQQFGMFSDGLNESDSG
jgi:hypothetical protein